MVLEMFFLRLLVLALLYLYFSQLLLVRNMYLSPRSFIDLLTSVLDFVTQSGILLRKQMMLLNIRPKFITEGYEVLVVLTH